MPSESVLVWGMALGVVALIVVPYVFFFQRRVARDRARKQEATRLKIDRPMAQYPYVDPNRCIGCGACVAACPEGDPLGIVGGTAVVINGLRCVGHGRCEAVCPVGAIEVGLGDLKSRADVPLLTSDLETTVPGVFVAGELGGLALVRNASLQGRQALDQIAARLRDGGGDGGGALDVAIIGAGPAGLAAALQAETLGLNYVTLEREASLGGSLLHYPRRKMVLTQPVELPPWGGLSREEYSKEDLLELFHSMVSDMQLNVSFGSPLTRLERQNGHFLLETANESLTSRFVLLTMGRRGTPRKLGVPGEELPKVMYRLLDAESYRDQKILVVGGGDSAIEAAIGLSRQRGNEVTLSYRKEKLVRIKKKNQEKIDDLIRKGKVRPLFASNVTEIGERSVRLAVGGSGGEPEAVEIENDYVFIFAGGVPPFAFLKQCGIGFGGEEVERAASSA